MPLKNLPKDWTPIFIALPDINKPPNYMVLKLYIFKPQEIKAPLVGGGDPPGQEAAKSFMVSFMSKSAF
jgi:hypothetical protein